MNTESKTPAEILVKESGFTLREIGERIGVKPQAVHETIKGRNRNPPTQYAIAMVLGRPLAEVFPDHPSVLARAA